MNVATEFARQIASAAPLAVRAILESVDTGLREGLEQGLDSERENFGWNYQTDDAHAGLDAFFRQAKTGFQWQMILPETLRGEGVILKRPLWSDMEFIRALWNDPVTMREVGGVVRLSDEQTVNWFARKIDPGSDSDGYWLIYDVTNRLIGEISFHRLVRATMTADFNLKIKHAVRRKGFARQAMRALFDYWFCEFGGQVMKDDVALDNFVGQQALLHFGFERDAGVADTCHLILTRERYRRLAKE